MASRIECLRRNVEEIEAWVNSWQAGYCGGVDSLALLGLANRLQNQVSALLNDRSSPATEDVTKLVAKAERVASFSDFGSDTKLPRIFKNNIEVLFGEMHVAPPETQRTRFKRNQTYQRCEKIRQLQPQYIVVWALSFAPSMWESSKMNESTFNSLLIQLQTLTVHPWPESIHETLQVIAQYPRRKMSAEFKEFQYNLRQSLCQVEERWDLDDYQPNHGNREMQHMFSNGPFSNIHSLPSRYQQAIRHSKQWRWERARGLETTTCVSTLFPKDETSDVSITLWVGHNEGYLLNDLLGVTPLWSIPPAAPPS
nr:uncharacterized protein CTRU02_05457 [Colletotrichum truncatum]KAF6793900.1 hypothetical protein CTRU02_05457 [Colletotrichum truncatum]